jgi:predicted ATP-grasp superfamily ATP-dependent carboligase
MKNKKILILDGDSICVYPIIKTLKKYDYIIELGSSSYLSPALFSKNIDNKFIYPNPYNNEINFHKFLISKLKKGKYNLIIPLKDITTEILVKYQFEYKNYTNILLPSIKSFNIFKSKSKTILKAREENIEVPNSLINDEITLKNLKKLKFPILIKPDNLAGSIGIKKFNNYKKSKFFFERYQNKSQKIIIQEYIKSISQYNVTLLFDKKSKYICGNVMRKLKYSHSFGGSTIIGESVKNNSVLKRSIKLLKKFKWKGIAEIEYILDENNKLLLIEVNPRFGDPIGCSISSGSNIIKNYLNISLNNNIKIQNHNKNVVWVNEYLLLLHLFKYGKIYINRYEYNKIKYAILSYTSFNIFVWQIFIFMVKKLFCGKRIWKEKK